MTTLAKSNGYQLRVGSLDLMDNVSSGYELNLLAGQATFGNAVSVAEVVENSLMRDGEGSFTSRYSNRQASFLLEVTAGDVSGLANAEAALWAELDKPNTLSWFAQDSPVTVFDVVRSWAEFQFDDLTEVRQRVRVFKVNFECLPFGRSVEPRTISWVGANEYLDIRTSAVSVISGGGVSNAAVSLPNGFGSSLAKSTGGIIEVTPDKPLKRFLGFLHDVTANAAFMQDLSVGGIAIPNVMSKAYSLSASVRQRIYDVSRWEGQRPVLRFTLVAPPGNPLHALYTSNYPNPISSEARPLGVIPAHVPTNLDVIDVQGSARADCVIRFTAPAGGAFVYTAPDPAAALADNGAQEIKFASFVVAPAGGATVAEGQTVMWFPQGTHYTQIGRSAGQVPILNPNGMWQTLTPNLGQYVYPADRQAAVSFFASTGAKVLVTPSPALPQGYRDDAVVHTSHVVHPGRCGFAVMDQYGQAVAATIEYYPTWMHHAAG